MQISTFFCGRILEARFHYSLHVPHIVVFTYVEVEGVGVWPSIIVVQLFLSTSLRSTMLQVRPKLVIGARLTELEVMRNLGPHLLVLLLVKLVLELSIPASTLPMLHEPNTVEVVMALRCLFLPRASAHGPGLCVRMSNHVRPLLG